MARKNHGGERRCEVLFISEDFSPSAPQTVKFDHLREDF